MGKTKVKRNPTFDATAAALGFLYQCRYALVLALQEDDQSKLVSIEKVDDVSFSNGSSTGKPFDLSQLKHHLSRQGGLGDKSLDIWKSIRIWVELIRSRKIDVNHVNLFLVTTSVATSRNAVRFLTRDHKLREPAKAQKLLEEAGGNSDAGKVVEAHELLMKLGTKRRKKLFESIYLLDGAEDVKELRDSIERHVRLLTDPAHKQAFADRLEGWWFASSIDHMMDKTSVGILVQELENHIHELREEFRRDNLPDEFLTAIVPASEVSNKDTRNFVRQLELIDTSSSRVQAAQEDHYRAYEQRSSWLRQHLLGIDELPRLETRLLGEWQRKFDIMIESLKDPKDESELVRSAKALYEWVETMAPSDQTLFVRPEFRSKYMTRGSYHMLADKKRVGWHADYDSRVDDHGGTNG